MSAKMQAITPEATTYAREMMRFIDASPSPFHAVTEARARLEKVGFIALDEREAWSLEPNQGYLVERGGGSLIAFRTGSVPALEAGFRMVGAHTDSPNIRLKPRLAKSAHKHLLLDTEPYGGLFIATWADRDLSVAGRVVLRAEGGGFEHRLFRSKEPICRIPNLAIHLNRGVNDQGLVLNKHTHLNPVAGAWDGERPQAPSDHVLAWLAGEVGCAPEDIVGHDLGLFEDLNGALSGLDRAYLQTGRLDNLASTYQGLTALLEQHNNTPHTRLLSLFDHEEVGSSSARGAESTFLGDVLSRIVGSEREGALVRALQKSYQVSADMAHAVHPNYADRHDGTHQPIMNAGPVIKNNVNTRYATDGETAAVFREACRVAGVPVQEFVNRPDLACGSTIGSITASRLGLKTVDVGCPMWSMHSIREMAGVADQVLMHRALSCFYQG